MRNKGSMGKKRAATALLAALLAVGLLSPVAAAEEVSTKAYPGTGGAIAFVSSRDGFAQFNVYRMAADGFGQTRLTDLPGRNM